MSDWHSRCPVNLKATKKVVRIEEIDSRARKKAWNTNVKFHVLARYETHRQWLHNKVRWWCWVRAVRTPWSVFFLSFFMWEKLLTGPRCPGRNDLVQRTNAMVLTFLIQESGHVLLIYEYFATTSDTSPCFSINSIRLHTVRECRSNVQGTRQSVFVSRTPQGGWCNGILKKLC